MPDPEFQVSLPTSWSFILELGEANIYVWDGNYFALEVTERLGLEDSGGMERVGPVHYNTVDEIKKFGQLLVEITT